MGLFDFLFGVKPPPYPHLRPDRVWLTRQAKWNAIQSAVGEFEQSEAAAMFLVAHFADTLEQTQLIAASYSGEGTVAALLAEDLSESLAKHVHLTSDVTVDFVVAERHPLKSVDDQLIEFAAVMPCKCRMTYHVSIEDTILTKFAGDSLGNVLRSLGMQESESIDSQMVQRQIIAAQKKVEQKALGNASAFSAEEWWQKNMPDG